LGEIEFKVRYWISEKLLQKRSGSGIPEEYQLNSNQESG
jgi:hypothetical protein